MTRCDCCNRMYDSTDTTYSDWCPECIAHDPKLQGMGHGAPLNEACDRYADMCPFYVWPDEDAAITGAGLR